MIMVFGRRSKNEYKITDLHWHYIIFLSKYCSISNDKRGNYTIGIRLKIIVKFQENSTQFQKNDYISSQNLFNHFKFHDI